MSHFVLEIGVEELPARFLPPLEKELQEAFMALQEELPFKDIAVRSTPRRAIVHLYGLAATSPVREEEMLGPAQKVAFDQDGQPTKAALGFAKGAGIEIKDAYTVETPKGVYIAARRKLGGRAALDVLAEACPRIIANLHFPKRMRWGKGSFAYARPIHWLLALIDDTLVPFTVGTIASSAQTFGHRVHGKGPFAVTHADALEEILAQKAQVVSNALSRRQTIMKEGEKLAAAKNATILWNDALLDEVQGLVEYPVPLLGDFNPSFLSLPKEVLLTSMQVHQKCFGVESTQNKALLPHFLTVLNVQPEDIAITKTGWERVLRARLEDARFYWDTDTKSSFPEWSEKLEHVVFLGPLGNMADKCRRLEALTVFLAENLLAPISEQTRAHAAMCGQYAKADLVSAMVGEFDTLQGIMGGIYATHFGLPTEVASALAEQYLPAGPDTSLPQSLLGSLLSIADKADTIVGCFGLGNIPTGAADPYSLRRAALGIARILMAKDFQLVPHTLFAKALSLYSPSIKWKFSQEEILAKLDEFFLTRLKNLLAASYDTLLVEATLAPCTVTSAAESAKSKQAAGNVGFLGLAQARLEALATAKDEASFPAMAQTFKRIANILRKQDTPPAPLNPALLAEDAEKTLAAAIQNTTPALETSWISADYLGYLTTLADLQPVIDTFFESVMVMAEDTALRQNRLALLAAIQAYVDRFADFSALQI